MNEGLFVKGDDGKITATKPFIAWCGCGTASRKIEKMFALAGVRLNDFPMARSQTNRSCKTFLESEGYIQLFPAFKKATHAVLIDPVSRKGVDVMQQNEQLIVQAIKEIAGKG